MFLGLSRSQSLLRQLETGGPAGSSYPADSLNHMLLVGEKKALQDAIDTGEK